MILWHAIVHFMGVDYGVAYGHWVWYNFWSGIAGSFAVNLTVFLLVWYAHHTCHDSRWCFRWGKYPVAGGLFRTCWKHHPDGDGVSKRPSRELIHQLHRRHKEAA